MNKAISYIGLGTVILLTVVGYLLFEYFIDQQPNVASNASKTAALNTSPNNALLSPSDASKTATAASLSSPTPPPASLPSSNPHIQERKEEAKPTGEDILKINRQAARRGDWVLFLESARRIREMPEHLRPTTLTAAIRENAPIHVFKALLDEGETFLPEHAIRIALENNLALLKQLIPLGLDIYITAPNGDNLLHTVLRTFNSLETFEFLLQNNVGIQPTVRGKKPLMIALEGAKLHTIAATHAALLVKHGADIEPGYLDFVHELAQSNPDAYAIIENTAPELIP